MQLLTCCLLVCGKVLQQGRGAASRRQLPPLGCCLLPCSTHQPACCRSGPHPAPPRRTCFFRLRVQGNMRLLLSARSAGLFARKFGVPFGARGTGNEASCVGRTGRRRGTPLEAVVFGSVRFASAN